MNKIYIFYFNKKFRINKINIYYNDDDDLIVDGALESVFFLFYFIFI